MTPPRLLPVLAVSLLPLCACLADDTPKGSAASAASAEGPASSPSACLYREQTTITCVGIPGGPSVDDAEMCQDGACPKRSEFSAPGSCCRSTLRSNLEVHAGTCEDVLRQKREGRLVAPACGTRLETGDLACSTCLERYCCDELESGAIDADTRELWACKDACYTATPVRGTPGPLSDDNYEARIPCLRACNDRFRGASDRLGPARGCAISDCREACRATDF